MNLMLLKGQHKKPTLKTKPIPLGLFLGFLLISHYLMENAVKHNLRHAAMKSPHRSFPLSQASKNGREAFQFLDL